VCPFVAALLPCLDAMKELYPAGENLCTTLPMRNEDAIEMALDKPLWRLLAANGATH